MCGLNFILDKQSKFSAEELRRMNAATQHRGPDFTHSFQHQSGGNTYYFGHNRLKILDCSDAANQPFFSADGRYILLYNGEIYNYQELRQDLKKQGLTFKTESDTEVLLALLIAEGIAALPKLNGMFAFVFFDTATNFLLVARDRFGLKPLYYADTSNCLIISSEIKGILASGLLPKELNESQLAEYLTFKHARKPQTFFKNIFELEEGSAGIYKNGSWQSSKYGSGFSTEKDTVFSRPEIVSQTEKLLKNSVSRQLQADVPVGLFLSGGVDSTLLLALLAENGYNNFPAFSIVNSEAERSFGSDDFYFAREAARQFGAEHHVFELSQEFLKEAPYLLENFDQPIADGAALLTSFISKQARSEVKVALSGAGADELFGGYNRHRAFYKYVNNRNLLLLAKPALQLAAPFLPTGTANPWRKHFRLIRKLATKIQNDPALTFQHFASMEPELRQLLKTESATFSEPNATVFPTKSAALSWALNYDLHEYLISDILALTDQTSMQHGLEVRAPYLDNELQNFTNNLKPELLFEHGQKWILKEILKKYNGEKYLCRAKEGFGMPLGLWFKTPKNAWLLEPIQNPKHILFRYLDFDKTQKLIQAHLQNRHDFSVEIWALLALAYWLQKHFGS
jgi:asparagine synthase (glutamine-hydrolysing)